MRRLIFITFITLYCLFSYSQTVTKYYKDKYLTKEVSEAKARYSLTIKKLPDGRTLSEVRYLKNNEIIKSEDNNGQPYGLWKIETGSGTVELDYNFELNYQDTTCKGEIPGPEINDPLSDNDSIGYVAPKLSTGEKNLYIFLANNIRYPEFARDNGISGMVIVRFTIDKKGVISGISVKKGAQVSLDKEAVRVIRLMNFSNPPTLNGQPQSSCITLPIKFMLQ